MQISEIKEFIGRRQVIQSGVDLLVESITQNGFLDNNPVVVTPVKTGGYRLIDGRHRYESALKLGIQEIPAIIKEKLSPIEEYQLASQCNNAAETVVPNNMVSDAEFIWAKLAETTEDDKKVYTQADVAVMLGGWSREKVKDYSRLQNINNEAWLEIGAVFQKLAPQDDKNTAPQIGATAPITEYLLRNITCLQPDHQHELVSDLIKGEITKAKFKALAQLYKARDKAALYVWGKLNRIDEKLLIEALSEIDSGKYDKEWVKKTNGKKTDDTAPTYPGTDELIQAQIDAYEKKNSIQLIHGDFYQKVKEIQDGSIDLIITDPPYNIAHTHNRPYDGRKDRSSDFGEWDKYGHEDFKKCFSDWFKEFSRIMSADSNGFIFTSDIYISYISEALQTQGFTHRSTITWHKTNPGTSQMKDNFISSNEYIVFFKRGKPVFNFTDDNEMQNFIQCPVCAGSERVKDSKQNVLHPTQKPQKVIRHLMDIGSNKGQKVFDGFMGVGTTAKVAKTTGRKFIGIEMEEKFFKAIEV